MFGCNRSSQAVITNGMECIPYGLKNILPPAMLKSSSCCTLLPAPGIISLLHSSNFGEHVIVSHYGFNFHFPDSVSSL